MNMNKLKNTKPVKILLGGSPCTHWSIAQKNNRETTAEGLGWELFKNYLIAKEKFKPDLFLYENNKSASQAIKDQIAQELGVGTDPDTRFTYINSALVSAQNRQRFYVTNFGDIEQPEDRGVVLKDILEVITDEQGYALRESSVAIGYRNRREKDGKLYRRFETSGEQKSNALTTVQTDCMIAEPIRIGDIGSTSQAHRVYSCEGKSTTINAGGGGQGGKTGLYICPVKVGEIDKGGQGNRIYSSDGKAIAQTANSGGIGSNTGLYAIPVNTTIDGIRNLITNNTDRRTRVAIPAEYAIDSPIYEVRNSEVEIKGRKYPIKLSDGFYIIRKLTVVECARLQTMPDDYCKAVSNSQAYKAYGNGWTAEVIIHLLNHALKDVPKDTPLEVLSMYDGIATGRYCLEKMGFTNITYHAYEINKYPIMVAMDNYPDIIQHGDAFQVREDDWNL